MLKRIKGPRAIALIVVVAAIAIAAFVAVSRAQAPAGPPPQRIVVTITQLKPDMVTTWEDLQKNEMIPAQKKAGLPWRHTLGNGASGQSFTRVTIGPLANYAQLDMPGFITRAVSAEANANYNAKVRPTILSQRQYIDTLQPDLSLQSNATTMQALQFVQVVELLPGKGNDFAASMKEDYLPAYKKAGVKDYWVYTTNQGAPGGERVLVRPIAKYADLDKPALLVQAGLSQEQQDKIGARRNATLAKGVETEVYRFIPELSYGTPTAVRSTN
jgi:hypothetical protein